MQISSQTRDSIARWLAGPMFGLSLVFLAIVATLVVLWVDVPRVGNSGELPAIPSSGPGSLSVIESFLVGMLELLWLIFWLEFAVQLLIRDRGSTSWRHVVRGLVICAVPPLRLCARAESQDDQVWLPTMGWQRTDEELFLRLERIFSFPMVLMALLILPVLLIEFGLQEQVAGRPWLRTVLHTGTGLIWFSFALEFIVMVSVAPKKARYCKEHWLDLAIILLPLISFLRSLRAVRAMRIARLARIQELTKMGRLFRLRGLALRGLRALLLLELVGRLFRIAPERKLRRVRELLREREAEVARLRSQVAELELQVAAQARPMATGPAPPSRERAG